MINQKYFNDIKHFPKQFKEGLELAKNITFERKFNKVLICGLGGSSLYVELINDYLASVNSTFRVDVCRGYSLPSNIDKETLIICASHSGNTEETVSCLREALQNDSLLCIFTAGGILHEKALEHTIPFFLMPKGTQPRLQTGHFIAGLFVILEKEGFIKDVEKEFERITENLEKNLDDNFAKELTESMYKKVPIIYSTDNNGSLARIVKIKFNENTKVQAFWSFFPEVNHNEMVGFTNLLMNPFFLIFKSKFTNERNHKRMDIFKKLLEEKGVTVKIIDLPGESVLEEILNGYYFADHITYYLAEKYEIDPEPVAMVEEFKVLLQM